jgi:hypothetical protein
MKSKGLRNGNRPGCTTLVVRHIPGKLLIRFQAWCKLRGISYKDKMIELLRKCIQDTSDPDVRTKTLTRIKRWEPTNRRISMRQIPTSLVRHFQAWCKLRDISVCEKVISMLEIVVQDTKGAE